MWRHTNPLTAKKKKTCLVLRWRCYRELSKEVKLVGDAAEAPISDFTNIKASLVEPPHHPSHLSFESWKKVYRCL